MATVTKAMQPAGRAATAVSKSARVLFVAALLVATALRLGFIFTTNTPAIYFDSVAYLGVSGDMVRLARAPGVMADMLSDLNRSGKDSASLKQTVESHGFRHISHINSRLVAYPLFLAMIRLFTHKIVYISIIQVLLDLITCCLLFVFASRLFNNGTGLVAVWIYALYPPLVISPHYVMSETLSAFLIVWLLLASHNMIEKGRTRDGACAGAALFLLFACRHAFQLLPLVIFPAFALVMFARGDSLKTAARKLVPAAIALVILTLPWMATLKAVFGNWLAPGQGGLTLYIGQRQETQAWQDDNWFVEIPGGTEAVIPSQDEYKRAAMVKIKEHPGDFALLFLEKIARLWSRPHNEYRVSYVLPASAWRAAHIAITLLGIAGILAALAAAPAAAIPAAMILHASLTHGLTLALARYNLPFMPVWIVFAAWAATMLPRLVRLFLPETRYKAALCVSCALLTLYFLKLNLPGREAPGAYFRNLGLAALAGFLWVSLTCCLRAARDECRRPAWTVATAVFAMGVFAALASMVYGNHNNLAWTYTLKAPESKAEQIIPAAHVNFDNIRRITLYVDVQAGASDLSHLEIRFNGKTIKRAGEPVRATHDFFGYLSGTYKHYRRIQKLDAMDFRQWFAFPIDAALFKQSNRIELACKGGRDAWCRIHGDYYVDKKHRRLFTPHFVFSQYESSIWKYVDEGDNRLMRFLTPHSPGAQSARYEHGARNRRDLSERIGVQRGQYRIRIVLDMKRGARRVL